MQLNAECYEGHITMDFISLSPRAKINVSLDVLSKRPDGYHELKMVMQTLRLHDSLFMKKNNTGQIILSTNLYYLPTNEKNLVYKVCQYMIDEFKISHGVYIELIKRIPVSAGLGGGSSDAASALYGMRRLFSLPLTNNDLVKIGQKFGADIPFFIHQGTQLAEGIGERLTPLPPHPWVAVLLCKPNFSISTGDVYDALNLQKITKRPDTPAIINALYNRDLISLASNMCNVLESVTETQNPIIGDIKAVMKANNALQAMMSGSGPTVFGYFLSKKDADAAKAAITRELGSMRNLIITDIYTKKRRKKGRE